MATFRPHLAVTCLIGSVAVACMIREPILHYYKVMTGSDRMPVLINQRI
jgi:hypothetical protein